MADKNLTVKIRGDNQGLSRSLRGAKGQVNKFGSFLKGFGARFGVLGAGLVGTAAAAGTIKLFVNATQEIDKIAKLAKQFGLSGEQIQVFDRVAKLSGLNLQELLKVFGNLNKTMLQFARDGTGAGMKAFEDLGLTAEQVGAAFKKGPVATLALLGDALKKVEDPIRRQALATEILGARGLKALPALEDAAAQFGQASKDIRELGLGLTPEELKTVEDYNDAWTRIFDTIENRSKKAAASLSDVMLPAVEKLEEALNNFLKGGGAPVAQPLGAAVNKGIDALKSQVPPLARHMAATNIVTGPAVALVELVQLVGAALEHGFEGVFARIRGNVAGGLRGAGAMVGFPLTGAALANQVNPPAGRGLPAPGTGHINGQSLKLMTREQNANTTQLRKLNTNMENFILNERTGARTAVAAE